MKGEAFLIDSDGNIVEFDQGQYRDHFGYLIDQGIIDVGEEPDDDDYDAWVEYEDRGNKALYDKGYSRVRQYIKDAAVVAAGEKAALMHPNTVADIMDRLGVQKIQYERGNNHEFGGDWIEYLDWYNKVKRYKQMASMLKDLRY